LHRQHGAQHIEKEKNKHQIQRNEKPRQPHAIGYSYDGFGQKRPPKHPDKKAQHKHNCHNDKQTLTHRQNIPKAKKNVVIFSEDK